jgi:Ni/Fe-hydrogenase subunit HybB-like protein
VIVLNIYLLLNLHICGYLLYMKYLGKKATYRFYIPFIFAAIIWAISIHTVTAFLFNGLGGRPFWNSAVLGPRFIASAFSSGPAFIVITLQIINHFTDYQIKKKALLILRKLIQVAMLISVFLFLNEFFVEFYTGSVHVGSIRYLFFGLHGYNGLVVWIWTAMIFNFASLFLLVHPMTRHIKYLNIACILCIVGIWIEKGMGLIIPGFIPTPLGQIVEYAPTFNEMLVSIGIWAFGFLLYTILLKISIPILLGTYNIGSTRIESK